MTTSRSFYITGGSLPGDAPSYIVRSADHQLLDALRRGQFCYILTSRQIGKSSLMVRTAIRLRQEGITCLVLDLTAIGQNMNEAQWYDGLLNLVARQLDLEEQLDDFWTTHTRLGPLQRWMLALEEVVLPNCGGRLVLFVDEIDAVRSLPFNADGFFAAIRECYNRRGHDRVFDGLTFCLLGVASPSDLIRDTRTTPFNIGTRIDLTDFSSEEAAPLMEGVVVHGGALPGTEQQRIVARELLARIMYWTGGHPYLTQRLCRAIAEALTTLPANARRPTPALVDQLCRQLFLSDDVRNRDDNLLFVRERLLRSEADRADLLTTYGKVWSGQRITYDEANPLIEILLLSGIVRVQQGYLRVRNLIYSRVFDRAWIAACMPDAALRQQRIAYRQGLLRALALSSVVLAAVIGLAAYGFRQADRAERNADLYRNAAIQRSKALEEVNSQRLLALNARQQANEKAQLAWQREHEAIAARNAQTLALKREKAARDEALRNRQRADWSAAESRRQRDQAEHLLYIADMNLIQESYANNDFTNVQEWLTQTRDSRFRGFEWGYWQRPYHLDSTPLKGHNDRLGNVPPIACSPDGKRIVTGSWDGTAKVWDTATGRNLLTLRGHSDLVWSVAFSPDGKRIVTGDADKTAKVWDAATGRVIRTLRGHDNTVRCAAFSPDGRRIVTGSRDGTAMVWDATSGQKLLTLRGHRGDVTSAAFSPDGKRIATGSDDTTTKLWDGTTGQQRLTLYGHTDRVTSLAFSPDGKRIVTGSGDRTAIVWDAVTGRKMSTLYGHTDRVTSVAFSPDGKRIVTGNGDDTARLWDAEMGRAVLTLQGHFGRVNSVAFSADGTQIRMKGPAGGDSVWYSDRFKGSGPKATLRPYQIGAGEGGVAPFSSDAFFSGGSAGGALSGVSTDGVLNPAPQAVYQSERFGITFSYTFPGLKPGAAYTVRLHFAEFFFTQPGSRLFNVKINGNQVLTDFDVLNSTFRKNQAIIEQFDIGADRAGVVTIDFQSLGNGAKVSGIEILPRDYYSRSGWTATASSSADATLPGRALDGNTGTRWTVADTPHIALPWFRVDMKSAHSISKIVLDNSNTPYDFPRGYAVYVSNDGLNWGSPIAMGSNAGVNYLDGTTIKFPTHTARYIQVVQTDSSDHAWSISEFYVYP